MDNFITEHLTDSCYGSVWMVFTSPKGYQYINQGKLGGKFDTGSVPSYTGHVPDQYMVVQSLQTMY